MIITPCEKHGLEHLVGVSPGGRSHGNLHISDLYGAYHRAIDPQKYSDGPMNPLYLEAGLSWEQILEKGLKERMTVERPGELTTPEGIVYSPDLLWIDGDRLVLVEIKLTWMSSREMPTIVTNGLPRKFQKYITQMASYCYHLDTIYGRLIGFFVNGNYKPPVPQMLAWDIEFTRRELRDEWEKLLRVGKAEGML